jgi:hypothetical protein
VCTCLAGALAKWTSGLHPPASCRQIAAYKTATAQILEVRSQPADPETTAGGTAFVVAGMRGRAWSAIDAIEIAPETDLGVTPHASSDAVIDRVETRPLGDTTLVWIESRHGTEETAMGEYTRSGEASTTVCVVPRGPSGPGEPAAAPASPASPASAAFCYASVPRSAWDYTEAITNPDAGCTVRSVTAFSDQLASGWLTVRVTHGADLKPVGRFRL